MRRQQGSGVGPPSPVWLASEVAQSYRTEPSAGGLDSTPGRRGQNGTAGLVTPSVSENWGTGHWCGNHTYLVLAGSSERTAQQGTGLISTDTVQTQRDVTGRQPVLQTHEAQISNHCYQEAPSMCMVLTGGHGILQLAQHLNLGGRT